MSHVSDFVILCMVMSPLCRVLTELVSKMRDMQMDKTELGCLRAIVLFNPGNYRSVSFHWLRLWKEAANYVFPKNMSNTFCCCLMFEWCGFKVCSFEMSHTKYQLKGVLSQKHNCCCWHISDVWLLLQNNHSFLSSLKISMCHGTATATVFYLCNRE